MGESLRITHVSVEDYLAGERLSDVRHEYVDGELFAMTGASRTHDALVANLLTRTRKRTSTSRPARRSSSRCCRA